MKGEKGFRQGAVQCLVTQSCLILCDPMDCSQPGSSVHGDSPGKNTGVGCHVLLQGIFPTQRLNLCLSHLLHLQVGSIWLYNPTLLSNRLWCTSEFLKDSSNSTYTNTY